MLGLVLLKGAVLFGIGMWRTKDRLAAMRLAIATSQGGEFAFVVVKLAFDRQLVTELEHLVVFIVGASLAPRRSSSRCSSASSLRSSFLRPRAPSTRSLKAMSSPC